MTTTTQVQQFTPPPLYMVPGVQTQIQPVPAPEVFQSESPYVLTEKGCVASIHLNSHWSPAYRAVMPAGKNLFLVFSHLATRKYHIKLAVHEMSLAGTEAKQALHDLLVRQASRERAQVLMPKDIRAIQNVLGSMGDNQFTKKGEPFSFRLSNAVTHTIKGKAVLLIQGDFIDSRTGSYVSEYRGLHFEEGDCVQELCLEGPPNNFAALVKDFNDIVDSIIWKN